MNYYIQGDAAKAEQIKAAFENKGFIKEDRSDIYENNVLFFTVDGDKNVHYCWLDEPYCNIVKTHPDYKELQLPVEPRFKEGDEIIWNEPKGSKPTEPVKIIQLIDKDQLYMVDMSNGVGYVAYDMQDYYKLVQKPHYDISNFHAGMPVLVRDFYKHNEWTYAIFSHYNKNHHETCRFMASGTGYWQCIPFEGNEHLLGTTDMCDEQYINW